ncbi:hypothetical protein FB45DRAFT_1022414 [Roridomyces roridus]|uniref:Ribonuclease H1 N-terminal domain-containing protein n=1 Tax=Roridomyces roridus TaxID=1738132 RepID=A0AAD7C8D0_9AGAR|nr:hypothetical protein FB45DRAFT_1022414 [Roridomyces roridus]
MSTNHQPEPPVNQGVGERMGLIYPSYIANKGLVCLDIRNGLPPTFANNPHILQGLFDPDPTNCKHCLKPLLRHEALGLDIAFTVITGCTHADTLRPDANKAVAAMLRPADKHKTCHGSVLVVKHAHSPDARISNRDLPLLDIVESDIPHLDELVRRVRLSFATYDPSPSIDRPVQRSATSVDDMDALLALLSLEDSSPARPTPVLASTASPPRSSANSPPAYSSLGALPASPRRQTPPPPAYIVPTLYQYSPSRHDPPRITPDWSQAGHAVQTGHGGFVRALHSSKKSKGKVNVYVVFRGRTTGVMNTWSEVRQATDGFRFALHQGYCSRPAAVAAFQYAQNRGWTSTTTTWTAIPIARAAVPHPIADATSPLPAALPPRDTGESWYVVHAGIHPGIFPTYLESALNTLGIDGALHEKYETFPEAQARFAGAQLRGEVTYL